MLYYKKQDLEFEDAYSYALRIISKQSCSTGKLKEKLLKKTNLETTNLVLKEITAHNFINNYSLCINTASMLVQKKPISKAQLCQKLYQYGFEKDDIYSVCKELEQEYQKGRIHTVGGYGMERLTEIAAECRQESLWTVLAFTSCLYTKTVSVKPLDSATICMRLKMKGYPVDDTIKSFVAKILAQNM